MRSHTINLEIVAFSHTLNTQDRSFFLCLSPPRSLVLTILNMCKISTREAFFNPKSKGLTSVHFHKIWNPEVPWTNYIWYITNWKTITGRKNPNLTLVQFFKKNFQIFEHCAFSMKAHFCLYTFPKVKILWLFNELTEQKTDTFKVCVHLQFHHNVIDAVTLCLIN